jgi:hypothetical protein
MTYTRISTVQELCELDPSAIDFALSDQVEHLSDLLVEAEKGAEEFFARNFVTQGMDFRRNNHRRQCRQAAGPARAQMGTSAGCGYWRHGLDWDCDGRIALAHRVDLGVHNAVWHRIHH